MLLHFKVRILTTLLTLNFQILFSGKKDINICNPEIIMVLGVDLQTNYITSQRISFLLFIPLGVYVNGKRSLRAKFPYDSKLIVVGRKMVEHNSITSCICWTFRDSLREKVFLTSKCHWEAKYLNFPRLKIDNMYLIIDTGS